MRLRKFVEAELTMTMKMKVVTLDEETPEDSFYTLGTQVETSRTQNGPVGSKMGE